MPNDHRPGFAIWLTGLPSSGKSTLACALQQLLAEQGMATLVLDSDQLRRCLTPNPTYTREERDAFYRALGELAERLAARGTNVLVAATAARRAYRRAARARIVRFAEVYVDAPTAVCRTRDPKGLWRRADEGEITTLPGAGVPYQPPRSPEVRVATSQATPEESARCIIQQLTAQGFFEEEG
ncbi:MAG: adenylyl-sulfate kinase [Anaerolineae bacterium]|jgi:adenylylsulfate kinase